LFAESSAYRLRELGALCRHSVWGWLSESARYVLMQLDPASGVLEDFGWVTH
jgi:hypothetical protein